MPLSDSGMSAAIKESLDAKFGPAFNDAHLKEWCDAVSKGIVKYIKANAEVDPSGTMIVTVGSFGAPTPVTGVGTIS